MAALTISLVACGGKKDDNANADNDVARTEATTETVTTEEADEKIVITVLTDKTWLVDTKLAEYKAVFEADNEDVEVQFEAVGNYEEEISKRLESGDYGDVLLIPDSVNNEQLVEYFEPLGTVEELSENYDEKYLQSRTVDGIVYGLPRYVNVQGIAYNETVFAKVGVIELPVTPEEFLSVLKKIRITQSNVIPYYTSYRNGEWLWKWQTHAWGSVSGDANYRNNGVVREREPFSEGTPNYIVHKLLYDIVENGLCENYVEEDNWKPAFAMLNRGEIGCMVLGSDYLHDLRVADSNPDDISLMPFPYNVDGKQYASVELDYCYAVNRNSPNKEKAKAWIEYILTKSGFAKSEGAVSIRKKASLPDVLSNFKGVEFVVNNAATEENEGKYETLNELSCIYLDSDTEKNRLVLAASHESDETFEDIMSDWNLRWQAALQGIPFAVVKEPEEGGDAESVLEITPEYRQFLEDMIERMQSSLDSAKKASGN